jgi:hypothetical protein
MGNGEATWKMYWQPARIWDILVPEVRYFSTSTAGEAYQPVTASAQPASSSRSASTWSKVSCISSLRSPASVAWGLLHQIRRARPASVSTYREFVRVSVFLCVSVLLYACVGACTSDFVRINVHRIVCCDVLCQQLWWYFVEHNINILNFHTGTLIHS